MGLAIDGEFGTALALKGWDNRVFRESRRKKNGSVFFIDAALFSGNFN